MSNTGNTQQIIDYGATANDGTGDPLRTAFIKTDENFDNIWLAGPVGSNITIANNTIQNDSTNGNIVIKPNGIGIVQSNAHVLPNITDVRNLGSADLRWRTLYVGIGGINSTGTINTADLDVSGDVTIQGNLTVEGDTIQIGNITTDTLLIQLANAASNSAQANGAGVTVGANDDIATLLYDAGNNAWTTNIGINVGGPITGTSFAVSTATIYGNLNGVDAYFTGNVTANYFAGDGSLLTNIDADNINGLANVAYTGDYNDLVNTPDLGNLTIDVLTTGNVTANYFIGNGSQLVDVDAHTLEGAAVDYNAIGDTIVLRDPNGNITGNYFIGDGSLLTGITSYANANAAAYGEAGWAGNIIPAANAYYTLGNSTNQWKSLYVSNTTIYINNVPISLTTGNVLTIAGEPILSNDSDTSITTTGNITANIITATESADLGSLNFYAATMSMADDLWNNINISPNVEGWAFLQIPKDSVANVDNVRLYNSAGNIELGSGDFSNDGPSYSWYFDKTGKLTAPGAINVGNMSIGELPGYITANANTGIIVNVSGPDGGFVVDYLKEDGNANTSQGELAFSSETGNTTYRISLTDDAGDGFATKIWRFDGTGNLNYPDGTISTGGATYAAANASVQMISNNAYNQVQVDDSNVYIYTSLNGISLQEWKFTGSGTLSLPGNITAGTNWINNLSDPVNAQDAATKNYVDTVAQGLHVHDSCNVATTQDLAAYTGATVTYNNGAGGVGATLTFSGNTLVDIDGFSLSAADRILVKNEANAVFNGIYVYSNATALTRSTDFDSDSEGLGGDFVFVTSGNTNADTGWVQTTDAPSIGNSNIVWQQFSSAGSYTANTAAGLVLNGSQFNAKVDGVTTAFDLNGNIIVKAGAALTTPNIDAATGTSLSLTGNVTAANFIGSGTNVDIIAGSYDWTFDNAGTLTLPGNTFAVNYANGTAVSLGGNYGNANVVANLAALSSNPISTTGNVTASYLFGNGSQLSAINAATVDVTNTNGLTTVYYPTFVESRTTAQTVRADVDLSYRTDTNTLTVGNISSAGNITGAYMLGNGSQLTGVASLSFSTVSANGTSVVADSATDTLTLTPGNNLVITGNATSDTVTLAVSDSPTFSGTVTAQSFSGNISVTGNVTGTSSNVNIIAGSYQWSFDNTGNLVLSGNTFAVNYANGTAVSIGGGGTPGGANTQVQFNDAGSFNGTAGLTFNKTTNALATTGTVSATGNVTGGNVLTGGLISATGNVTGSYLFGNISQATGGYGNANVVANLAALASNPISTTGNITAGNITITGNTATGINAVTVGVNNVILPNTIASFSSNVNGYTQLTLENINSGADATADFILTADNGSDTVNYGDFGIINSGYDPNTPTNSLGNIVYAADTYIYAQGNTSNTAQAGGNLVMGVTTASKNIKLFAGGANTSALIATISNAGITMNSGNITGNTAGFAIGYRDIPQVSFSANATISTSDAGKHYYSTSASNLVLTIANNASQAFAIGAAINIINRGTGTMTIAQGSGVTLYLAGNTTSGNRTLSSYGAATIQKVETDVWFVVGTGLT